MTLSNEPFFIVGVHRSGTTLLRYMLSSSPRIYVPPESDFIPAFFLKQPLRPLRQAQVADLLHTIFHKYRFVREWEGDPPEAGAFYQTLPEPTPAAFLQALYGQYATQKGAVRWGDKTPIYSSYINLLHILFPQAQFIHIIRDGRDVALSMIDKWGQKEPHVDIYFAARNWVRRIRQAQEAGQRLGPAQFYELHYEDLVADPEPHLQAVCRFLDETYLPQMAAQHQLARESVARGSFHAPVRQPPSTSRIGRWQKEMSAADLRLFEQVAGPLLTELNYELAATGQDSVTDHGRKAALAFKYWLLQTGRRGLQAVGLKPPI